MKDFANIDFYEPLIVTKFSSIFVHKLFKTMKLLIENLSPEETKVLTANAFRMLILLSFGRKVNDSALFELMNCSRGTYYSAKKELREKGFLSKRQYPTGARQWKVISEMENKQFRKRKIKVTNYEKVEHSNE